MISKFLKIKNYKNKQLLLNAPYNKEIISEYKKIGGEWINDLAIWAFNIDKKNDLSFLLDTYFGENGFDDPKYVDVYLSGNAVNNGNIKGKESYEFSFQGRILVSKYTKTKVGIEEIIRLDSNLELIEGEYANSFKEFSDIKFFKYLPLCGKNVKLKLRNVPINYIEKNNFDDFVVDIIKL